MSSRPSSPARPRFLSEADCHDIAQRLARYAVGGGTTDVFIVSRWTGNVRWARNRITTSGEDRDNQVTVRRQIRGASTYNCVIFNDVSDAALVAATRRAERLTHDDREVFDYDLGTRPGSPLRYRDEPVTVPRLFFESTYQLDAGARAGAARQLMQAATAAGMLAAGYIEVSATSVAYITSWGYARYYQYTWAQYSNTVRDPKGVGSGWAGVDWPDWSKIDGDKLSAIALDKCLKSRNPVAVEPGRYTTILEPQAVCDFVSPWGFKREWKDGIENSKGGAWHKSDRDPPPYGRPEFLKYMDQVGFARFGERVIDERLTLSSDPLDPELSFPIYNRSPNTHDLEVYHPVTWIERGILKNLVYTRDYATENLGKDVGLPASGAFRMSVSGQTSSIDEMIETTKRGLLVTRFDRIDQAGDLIYRGYTRDGLWLIENGKISKAVKNLVFVESILFALNNVEQVGVPQRCFHPGQGGYLAWLENPQPVIAPALKIRDFSFTALSAAI